MRVGYRRSCPGDEVEVLERVDHDGDCRRRLRVAGQARERDVVGRGIGDHDFVAGSALHEPERLRERKGQDAAEAVHSQCVRDKPPAPNGLAGQPDRGAACTARHVSRVPAESCHVDDGERWLEFGGSSVEPAQAVVRSCHWRASGTMLIGAPPARCSLARLRHDAHCSSSAVRAVYSAADSRTGGTWSPESSWILKSQPAPYGSEFTRPGSSSISGLTSVTSPSTG